MIYVVTLDEEECTDMIRFLVMVLETFMWRKVFLGSVIQEESPNPV